MASRGIYHDGWFAGTIGPRIPWLPGTPAGIKDWTPDKDRWELYNLEEDWTQADDLADSMPEKLAELKELFAIEFARNSGYPVGGGLWVPVFHPELRSSPPYQEWTFPEAITRMPEGTAPRLGTLANVVTIEADVPADAQGVLYALGAFSGGLALYVHDGVLSYEYNLFELDRTQIRADRALPAGKVTIEVETRPLESRPASPLEVTLKVGGEVVGQGRVPISAPLLFTANDCFDIGTDLGSPVSTDYFDQAPYPFNGTIEQVLVKYRDAP